MQAILHWHLSYSLNNIIVQLLQRLRVPVTLKPGASKVALFQYITEAFLSYCRTDIIGQFTDQNTWRS